MVSRENVLALVRGAPGRLRTLEAALVRWSDHSLVAAVHERLAGVGAAPLRSTDAAIVGVSMSPSPAQGRRHAGGHRVDGVDQARPSTAEDDLLAYVVVDLPDRWRVVGRGHVTVCDGATSWVGTGTLVTEHDGARASLHEAGPIGACLYPAPLLGWLEIGSPKAEELAGRWCWMVEAVPRADGAAPPGGGESGSLAPPPVRVPDEFLGYEHRFWFDARTGIVLRHEGFIDGRPCAGTELTDVVVDEPVHRDEFAPPPDAIVRPSHELLRDHLADLGVDPDGVDLDDAEDVRRALRLGAVSPSGGDAGSDPGAVGGSTG